MSNDISEGGIIGAATTVLLATGITSEYVQIVYYILAGVALLFSLAFTIWKWYRVAKSDGKITKEELDELEKQIESTIEEAKKEIK